MNNLLIAWAILGYTDAISSEFAYLDDKGFNLKLECKNVFTGTIRQEIATYEFENSHPTKEGIEKELERLITTSRISSWPPGPGALVSVLLIVSAFVCSVEGDLDYASIYIKKLREISLFVYQSAYYARIVFALVIAGHGLEALYVTTICRRLRFNIFQIATWVMLVFVTGIATTSRLMFLDKLYAKQQSEVKVNIFASSSFPVIKSLLGQIIECDRHTL